MHIMIKKLRNVVYGIELSKRQLEKVAEQLRLLSWGLSVILTSTNGFHLESNFIVLPIVVVLWLFLQFIAIIMDKRSESK